MIFVLAEKPSVARELQQVIREPGVAFGAARGHLFELLKPQEYLSGEQRYLKIEDLPIVPPDMEFKYLVKKDDPKYKGGGTTYKELVAQLLDVCSKADEIVCATDAGREGELIFWEFLRHFQKKFPNARPRLTRLWAQSTTPAALQDAFRTRQPLSHTMGLAQAAHGRQWADWVWGMNLSSAAQNTLPRTTDGKTWSIGRVQTPVLAILVDREDEIAAFVAKPFWEIDVTVKNENHPDAYIAKLLAQLEEETPTSGETSEAEDTKLATRTRFDDKSRVEALRAKAGQVGRTWQVTETKTRATQKPPSLFSLPTLQQFMNRTFGWSAADTLKVAQSCYETHKILTYPRTEADALPSDYVETATKLHAWLVGYLQIPGDRMDLFPNPEQSTRRKAIFDDSKVTDHFAVVPTGQPMPDNIDPNARLMFQVVSDRFLTALAPEAVYEVCARRLTSEDLAAVARGRVLVSPGWTATKKALAQLGKGAPAPEAEKDDATPALPPLDPNAPRATTAEPGAKTRESKTAPPPHHTEASLLSAMEHVDRLILAKNRALSEDDEEAEEEGDIATLASAAAKRGLGTPATRADIIEKLLSPARQLITRSSGEGKKTKKKKTYLIPTEKGNFLIKTLRNVGLAKVADPITTAEWEVKLQRLEEAKGEFHCNASEFGAAENYITELLPLVREAIEKLKPLAGNRPDAQPPKPTDAICPKSMEPVTDNGNYFKFPGYPKAFFNKIICGATIPLEEYVFLVATPGSIGEEKEFTHPKTGSKFKGKLTFDEKEEKINFYRAPQGPRNADASGVLCPKSKKPVTSNEKNYFFEGYPDVWFNKDMLGRKMSAQDFVDILASKDGVRYTNFISKNTQKEYAATLKFAPRKKKIELVFDRR